MRRLSPFVSLCLLLLITFFSEGVMGQGANPTAIMDMVKHNSAKYYYGEGMAQDYHDARKKALSNLTEQISINISTSSQLVSEAQSVGNKEVITNTLATTINTYTNDVELENLKWIELADGFDGKDAHVFCYVERAEMRKQWEQGRLNVLEWVREGDKYESENNVEFALQNYYESLIMLMTLPRYDTISYVTADGMSKNISKYLTDKIKDIIDNLKFEVSAITEDDYKVTTALRITYKDKPVKKCAFRYHGGTGMNYATIAKDGYGEAQFPVRPSNINIEVEYYPKEHLKVNPKLKKIYDNLESQARLPKFEKENKKRIAVDATKLNNDLTAVQSEPAVSLATAEKMKGTAAQSTLDSCTEIVNEVVTAIRTKNINSVKEHFTEQGWDIFTKLVNNGNATVIRKPDIKFLVVENAILCRAIPMSFKFPRSGKNIIENVELRFSPTDRKIESLAFTLHESAENDILDPTKKWDNNSRAILIQFLENYQTAYSLQRIDYLDEIFSENALIITGTKLRVTPKTENSPQLKSGKNDIIYLQQKKQEYINRLRRIFKNNEFVTLSFKDNDVIKANGCEIYGIQIRQLYSSSSYADEGYLFLLVDLRNPDVPVIHVRTWQPDKDPNFGIYSTKNFKFNCTDL